MGPRAVTVLSLAAVLVVGFAPVADAAPDNRRPCVRAGEERVLREGKVVIARKVTKTTRWGGYEASVFACWRPTRLRTLIGSESDRPYVGGSDLEIHVDRRYVGVLAELWTEVVGIRDVRVYDARRGRRVHRSAVCHEVGRRGVFAAEFLPGGGVAYSCADSGAYLWRGPGAARETLEPDALVAEFGTEVDASGALWLTWRLERDPPGAVSGRVQISAAAT